MRTTIARRSTGSLTANVQERHVLVRGRITKQIASCSIARLLVLATDNQQAPIVIYIESPGGSIFDSLGMISTMNGVRCPVATFCRGLIEGTAVVLAAHGAKGCRTASSEAQFSLKLPEPRQERTGSSSQDSFLQMLVETLATDTGKPQAQVLNWLVNGAEFTARQALANGLIDRIADQPVIPAPEGAGSPNLAKPETKDAR